MKRPNPEFNAGAQQTRKRIIHHLQSLDSATTDVLALILWVKGMSKRSAKRPGGQGAK